MSEDMNDSLISEVDAFEEIYKDSRFFDINDTTYEDSTNRSTANIENFDSTKNITLVPLSESLRYSSEGVISKHNPLENEKIGNKVTNELIPKVDSKHIQSSEILTPIPFVAKELKSNPIISTSNKANMLNVESNEKNPINMTFSNQINKDPSSDLNQEEILKQPITMNTMVYLHLQNKKKLQNDTKKVPFNYNCPSTTNQFLYQNPPNNMLNMYLYQNYLNMLIPQGFVNPQVPIPTLNTPNLADTEADISSKKVKKVKKKKKVKVYSCTEENNNLAENSAIVNNIGKTTKKKKKKVTDNIIV